MNKPVYKNNPIFIARIVTAGNIQIFTPGKMHVFSNGIWGIFAIH
jgi:hypothetical protein